MSNQLPLTTQAPQTVATAHSKRNTFSTGEETSCVIVGYSVQFHLPNEIDAGTLHLAKKREPAIWDRFPGTERQ